MDEINLRYIEICNKIDELEYTLNQMQLELFTLNPKITKTIDEIYRLKLEKKELEDLFNEEKQ